MSKLAKPSFRHGSPESSHRDVKRGLETLPPTCYEADPNAYTKIVEWSDEDQCFIGSCPGLFYGGCHGSDEVKVFMRLCEIVEETIELYKQDAKPNS